MSYDLYFRRRNGSGPIAPDEFADYFADREHYDVPGAYANEDTGVYFNFTREGDDDEPANDASACFNMNYCRPHVFGLEAEPEVAAFVAALDLDVDDPQDGMVDGAYSRAGFLRGWDNGNRLGHVALAERGEVLALPSAEIERCWRWNLGRASLQEALAERLFVPRIAFGERSGKALTFCVWPPDAIPIALPQVELVAIGRQGLAPKKLLIFAQPDLVFVEHATLDRLLSACPMATADEHRPYRDVVAAPSELIDFIRKLPACADKLAAIPPDRVLDAELV